MDKARQTAEQARAGVLGERNGDGADPDAPPPPSPGARISEMYLTASIPPQIGFSIARMGDTEEVEAAPLVKAPVRKVAAPAKKPAPRPAGP